MKTKQIICLNLVLSISFSFVVGQAKIIFDAEKDSPVEFASVVVLKSRHGVYSDQKGSFTMKDLHLQLHDSILINHIGYQAKYFDASSFLKSDTIFLTPTVNKLDDVIIKETIKKGSFTKEEKFGFFQSKDEGALFMRPGEQIAVRMDNTTHLKGIISSIKLHFESVMPNSEFRVSIRRRNHDGSVGNSLLRKDLMLKGSSKSPTIQLMNYELFFPFDGVYVVLEYLGDGHIYQKHLDAPYIVYRMTSSYPGINTYNNYMEAYSWNLFSSLLPNKKFPQNAQIQLTVLSK